MLQTYIEKRLQTDRKNLAGRQAEEGKREEQNRVALDSLVP